MFLSLLVFLNFFYSLVLVRKEVRRAVELVKSHVLLGVTFLVTVVVFLYPYIKSSYFSPGLDENLMNSTNVNRPEGDFIIFSTRPWYFLLPSVRNVIVGDIGEHVIGNLESAGNYLLNNYFHDEHAGSFLGWINILFIVLLLINLLKNKVESADKKMLLKYIYLAVALALFAMPPVFIISDVKFYSPGYLISNLFPMFRVTARISVIILFLVINLVCFYFDFIEKRISKRIFMLLIFLVMLLNILQMYVPVTITDVSTPPRIFSYLKESTSQDATIAVYPYRETTKALFWMREHQRGLANPADFYTAQFNSLKFTSSLAKPGGVKDAKKLGVDYIVVFKKTDPKALESFSINSMLNLEIEFSDSLLYKVL